MRIVVLGWGSLIWCPGSLRLQTRWHRDGPDLPLEFARISRDGRLTLVIHEGSAHQTVLWAVSQLTDLARARKDLKEREGCSPADIHSLEQDGTTEGHVTASIGTSIGGWLRSKADIDAAIWTGLSCNWRERRDREFTPDDAVDYLKGLEESAQNAAEALKRAREYLRCAPSQIQTEVRKRMSVGDDWKDNELSGTLFES